MIALAKYSYRKGINQSEITRITLQSKLITVISYEGIYEMRLF